MRRSPLLTIFLIVFVDLLGFGILLPNLQLYGLALGISSTLALTLLSTSYSLFQFIFAPLLGHWSDRIGRRPVLLMSQAGTLLGFLMLFGVHFCRGPLLPLGIALMYTSRILDGASGGNISTASAYIADITTPENRAKGMGLIGAAFGLGFVFGPLLGGLVAYYLGIQYVALAAAGFSLTALMMTYRLLPESRHPQPENPTANDAAARRFSWGALRQALDHPAIGPLIAMAFVNSLAFAGMEATYSLLLQHRFYPVTAERPVAVASRLASGTAGWFFCYIGILIVIIQGGLIGRLTKRFGETALVIVGPILVASGLLLIGCPATWNWPWTGFFVGSGLMALGSGLFNPSVQGLISRHAASHQQGQMLGANQGLASLARAIGPATAGWLFSNVAPEAPYWFSGLVTLGVAGAAILLRGRLKART